jgi:hypothetical protein
MIPSMLIREQTYEFYKGTVDTFAHVLRGEDHQYFQITDPDGRAGAEGWHYQIEDIDAQTDPHLTMTIKFIAVF